MDRADIFEKVVNLTSEALEVDSEGLTEQTEFKSLGADSFDLLELVTAFEDEFGLTLDDEVLQNIATVADAVNAICDAQ